MAKDECQGAMAATYQVAGRWLRVLRRFIFQNIFMAAGLASTAFISVFSGLLIDAQGYIFFFAYAVALGLPAVFMVLYLIKQQNENTDTIRT